MTSVSNVLRDQLSRTVAFSSRLMREPNTSFNEEKIRKLLLSSSTREKTEGLRELLSKVSEGFNAQSFFADVVKTVFERDLEVREMSASFLIMYSQCEPELTLMIVNCVQKMLGDQSSILRTQALRLASALRVPTIAPLVAHLIGEVVNDKSPTVRSACFQAIGKCYELDPSLGSDLLNLLSDMLSSPKQTSSHFEVSGWGLATLELYWPQRIDLLHPFYRIYVPQISEFDEWCQILVCRLFVRYCRHYMTGPEDEDVNLLVEAVEPLLTSLNTAVVVEAVAVLNYMESGRFEELHVVERLLSMEKSALLWSSIFTLCQEKPSIFNEHRSEIINSLSTIESQSLRIQALKVVTHCNETELSKSELWSLKLCALAWSSDLPSLKAVMNAITVLVGPALVHSTLRWLVGLATNKKQSSELISESLISLRILIQQHQIENIKSLLATLANLVVSVEVHPSAKATIIWLMGVNCLEHPDICTELLRKLLKVVTNEPEVVRLQTLQLAAKLNTAFKNDSRNFDDRIPKFFEFALMIARFDQSVDIRDRARLFNSLASVTEENSMATLLLEAAKPMPVADGDKQVKFVIDTASEYFGKYLDGYTNIENWGTEDTSALRSVSITIDPTTKEIFADKETKNPGAHNLPEINSTNKMSFEEFIGADETNLEENK